ncbi:uncharacterized protein Ga0609869_002322 [Rhodovulum iodosum]|uniref:GYD domain-containing protein n=1 Tax=Rhodovulum iodosum TaxID=68291 RepID=A0ABV3XUF2_9RHOB|nr:GYD domain-containing protein [Rhodovulum robiginosum]RSK35022.1 GYD domain-containing protein [Rhodovulum robiginosum]
MATHMTQFSYSGDAIKALVDKPQNRREAVSKVIEAAGGKMEEMYFTFGEFDGVALVSFPSNVDGAAALLTIGASGTLSRMQTTVLLSVEDSVKAMEKAKSLRDSFVPAGG